MAVAFSVGMSASVSSKEKGKFESILRLSDINSVLLGIREKIKKVENEISLS